MKECPFVHKYALKLNKEYTVSANCTAFIMSYTNALPLKWVGEIFSGTPVKHMEDDLRASLYSVKKIIN